MKHINANVCTDIHNKTDINWHFMAWKWLKWILPCKISSEKAEPMWRVKHFIWMVERKRETGGFPTLQFF